MKIKIHHVTKTIKDNMILDDINLEMESGNIYGFVGINGSGKTMLMRMIAGLIRPTEGTVSVDGKELHKEISFPPDMGLIIEKPELLDHLTGLENLKLLAGIKKKVTEGQMKSFLEQFGLDPNDKRPLRKYSLGMKQKIGIIQAIMEDPQLLIMDEPFNALDEGTVEMLRNLFIEYKQQGKLIIMTSHHSEDIELLCDETVYMQDGKIKKKTLKDVEIQRDA